MLAKFRNSVLLRFFWGLMGLYLLNFSVDVADDVSENTYEDLTINDQESFVEIFLEQILGYEDAIAEYDDHDSDHETTNKQSVKLEFLVHEAEVVNQSEFFVGCSLKFPGYQEEPTGGFHLLDTPPPIA